MATPSEIIRCLRHDGYSTNEAIAYCERIATNCRYNPDSGENCYNYTEAARRLRETADSAPPHPQAETIRRIATERAAASAALDAEFFNPSTP
jgi:hypothetical protein